MHTLHLSEAEKEQLNYERFYYPDPLVQKRLHTVYLKGALEYSHQEIGKIIGRHRNTITADIKRYNSKGIEGLKEVNYGTIKSDLFGKHS